MFRLKKTPRDTRDETGEHVSSILSVKFDSNQSDDRFSTDNFGTNGSNGSKYESVLQDVPDDALSYVSAGPLVKLEKPRTNDSQYDTLSEAARALADERRFMTSPGTLFLFIHFHFHFFLARSSHLFLLFSLFIDRWFSFFT